MENDKIICRTCKKIKFGKIYVILREEVKEGFIDENDRFVYTNENGKIIRLSRFDSKKFLHDKNPDIIGYIDDTTIEDLIQDYDTCHSLEQVKQKFTLETNNLLTLVYYNKNYKYYDSLELKHKELSRVVSIKEALECSENLNLWGQDGDIQFIDDYVMIHINEIKKIISKSKSDTDDDREYIKNATNSILGYYGQVEEAKEAKKENKKKESKQESSKKENTKNYKEQLNSLIGLKNIKEEINRLSNVLKYNKYIKDNKIDIVLDKMNLNMVFLGNPGTGKTTVAIIVSKLLQELGLANDKFKEVTAKDLIAGYVGQTALKTRELLDSVKGGVLLIDEAYTLSCTSDADSFNKEALAEILKEMEKNRIVFIFAGYKKEMEAFIKSNSGLTSRIHNYFDFPDYSIDELLQIFMNKLKTKHYELNSECLDKIKEIISNAKLKEDFGNGRFIDKLFETIIVEHANNIVNNNESLENVSLDNLKTITLSDINDEQIKQILYEKVKTKKPIGF